MNRSLTFSLVVAGLILPASLRAESPPLDLPRAVRLAAERYPAVQAALERASAAASGVNLARTAYLPHADLLGQVNRATRNNVFGLLLPQPVIPSISGPVLGTNNFTNVWGSAAGLLASWEPFDFGRRHADVESAESTRRKGEASVVRTRLDVSVAAAEAFLGVLAAEQAVLVSRASAARIGVVRDAVQALVSAELRPGADLERVRAEAAGVEAQLIESEQTLAVARASLAQLLGVDASAMSLQPGPLLTVAPPMDGTVASPADHPAAREQHAAVEEEEARQQALSRLYFPRFNLQAATFARGTGARTNGTTEGGWNGLAPDTFNWAIGLTVTFPLMEIHSIRARREVEAHRERAEAARYDQVLRDLEGRTNQSRALVDGARRLVQTAATRLEAARATRQQVVARYQAGLATIVDVADAERLQTQAEIDDALANLKTWRAELSLAFASGDLTPFLAAAGR